MDAGKGRGLSRPARLPHPCTHVLDNLLRDQANIDPLRHLAPFASLHRARLRGRLDRPERRDFDPELRGGVGDRARRDTRREVSADLVDSRRAGVGEAGVSDRRGEAEWAAAGGACQAVNRASEQPAIQPELATTQKPAGRTQRDTRPSRGTSSSCPSKLTSPEGSTRRPATQSAPSHHSPRGTALMSTGTWLDPLSPVRNTVRWLMSYGRSRGNTKCVSSLWVSATLRRASRHRSRLRTSRRRITQHPPPLHPGRPYRGGALHPRPPIPWGALTCAAGWSGQAAQQRWRRTWFCPSGWQVWNAIHLQPPAGT